MQGDVVGCLLDAGAHRVSFTLNGRDLGAAFELPEYLPGRQQALYPALTLKEGAAAANFGASGFKDGPPAGFVGIGTPAAAEFVTSGASQLASSPVIMHP
jgi:ATP-dependent RNA helicase DDX1